MATNPRQIVAIPVEGNPFEQPTKKTIVAVPVEGNPFEQEKPDSSVISSTVHSAEREVVPALGGAAGFGAGAAIGGTLTAPAEAIPIVGTAVNALGALGGGLAGAFGGHAAVQKMQDMATSLVPDRVKAWFGQDKAQQQADQTQHPYASFVGQLAPNLITMRPGALVDAPLKEGTNWAERLIANKFTAPAVGATLSGGGEAANEYSSGQGFDPTKIAIATGAGALMNKPTKAGEYLIGRGGSAAIKGMQVGARQAGRAWGTIRPEPTAQPDFDNMRNVTPAAPKRLVAVPVEGNPFEPTARPIEPAPRPPKPEPQSPPLPAKLTPAEPPEAPEAPELADGDHHVTTPAGQKISARFEVVPAATLQYASGDLQNRDRSREATDLQVQDIVSKFDPERLGASAETDRGAPIVGPDHVIESGNGRVMALNKIYDDPAHAEKAEAYRQFIESQGHSTEGIQNPILIRRRTNDMTPEERRASIIASNKDAKLEMSPSERARSDADSITPGLLAKYAGGDLNSTPNQGFVEGFNRNLTAGELGNMIGNDRRLTTTGKQRIENAIVARAYGNPKVLERMMEAPNDDIRAITGSMADVAAPWARLRQSAEAGDVPKKYDITDQLADAAARVSHARKSGTKPADILAQADAFDPIHPITESLIRAFYNPEMTRAASRKTVTDFLHDYVREAEAQTSTDGLFGEEEPKDPVDILHSLLEKQGHDRGQLLEAPQPEPTITELGDALTARLNKRKAERLAKSEKEPHHDTIGTPERHEKSDARPAEEGRDESESREGEGSERSESLTDDPDYSAGRVVEDASPKSFDDASFTRRASIYSTAATALGIDPDKFTLMPAPRQVALLRQALKKVFGVEVLVDKGMQERFAIDQMLDAFQNVQGMAHVLGLPANGISLGGTLKLSLQKNGKFLGAYQPSNSLIMLPRRSNSFAHEWGHALDYYLLDAMAKGEATKGISGLIRNRGTGTVGDPVNVKEAFADVLNAMFFDEAAVAREVMELEAKIQQTNSEKVKALAQAQLDRIREGNSQKQGTRSIFYRNAKSVDAKAGSEYWTSPTEMFARAFEAYVSYMVEAQGLTTEFIGKGDAQYLSEAEERFAKTFPHGEERSVIFAAMEKLFANIAEQAMLGKGRAAKPDAGVVNRITDFDRTPKVKRETNIIKREMAAIKRQFARTKRELADRAANPKGFRERMKDLQANAFYSMAANMRMIAARSNSAAARELADLLTKLDGQGSRTVPRTFEEDVHIQGNISLNRLSNIVRASGLDDLDEHQTMVLRDLLIGAREDGPDNLVKGAANLRRLLDHEWHINQKAGIDLGYTRNGYLSRVLDMPKVMNDEDGFVVSAAKVYHLVFDKQFGDPDNVLGDDDLTTQFMKVARRLTKMGYDIPDFEEVRKALRQIKKLGKEAAKSDEPDQIQAKVNKLAEQISDRFGDLYDQVKAAFGQQRAIEWLAAIQLSDGESNPVGAPDVKYTKHRELPPETDKIMEKFFLSDPVESIANYLKKSAKRTAYVRRFGVKNEKREDLFKRMATEGVSGADRRTLSRIVDAITGRRVSSLPESIQDGAAFLSSITQLALLPRAMLSSLAEPFTAGLVTGNSLHGFDMLGKMIAATFKSPNGAARHDLARAMGIIADISASDIMQARYGQSYAGETRWDRATHKMYERTGLLRLTNAQKSAAVGVSHAFLDRLARIIAGEKKGSEADVTSAIALFREFGIRNPESFAKEMVQRDSIPSVEDLDSDFGYDYSTAQGRLSRMMIQEPEMVDRPLVASDPVLRVMYGIFGFTMGYWRNIVKRNAKLLADTANPKTGRGGKSKAALYASSLFVAAATAYIMNTVISTIRERLQNPKRWDDLEKSGDLWSTMAELGATRAFSLGLGDTLIQSLTGLKYRRDLSNVAIGAGPATGLQDVQKMTQPLANNSRKTNTAEFNATAGAYSLASPFLAFGLSRLPGGPLLETAYGAGMMYVTSPSARDSVAGMIWGPKNGSVINGKKVKSGPSRYDRALNDAFGPEKKKPRGIASH